jgi:hemerythrin-like domain-containing protein
MKAIDVLKEEHRIIERAITALDFATKSAAHNKPVRPGFFIDMAEFSQKFTDGCHHKKEEEILFKALSNNGIAIEGGPVGVMLTEHAQGREFTSTMLSAAEAWAAGDEGGRAEVIWTASSLVTLMRQHMQKENSILFALAEQAIPPEEQDQVSRAFEQFDPQETGEEINKRYSAQAEALEKEAATWR